MKITFISDTHTKHMMCGNDIPGGDMIIHSGDLMNSGILKSDLIDFLDWFDGLDYTHKVFIAGNHDRLFEDDPKSAMEIVRQYPGITYLQDSLYGVNDISIWGSPWQPEFYNWAFNLPRNGLELHEKWSEIPNHLTILITHGPPYGHLDTISPGSENIGCERLRPFVESTKPLIHVFGHIHGGSGYKFDGTTHYINAAILNERYEYVNKPKTIELSLETKEIKFLE